MADRQSKDGRNAHTAAANFAVSAPKLSLPKGAGAIRGMGQKFATIRSPAPVRCGCRSRPVWVLWYWPLVTTNTSVQCHCRGLAYRESEVLHRNRAQPV